MPPKTTAAGILKKLYSLSDPARIEGAARFAVPTHNVLGIPAPVLKKITREIGRDQAIAEALWRSGIHEARSLAAMTADPAQITERQVERWVREFDSWDICDGSCLYLFAYLPYEWRKVFEWSRREREFEKRAGFALAAVLAVHDKGAPDEKFLKFLPVIKREAADNRNFVKKAVNWALRQIGKRNRKLNRAAIRTAREIRRQDSPSARWIASDALRELTGKPVQSRLRGGRATSASC
jgi:3-methyladenine DNA glycosylase AlkD